jgi:DNA topoisomerase-3
LDRDYPDVRTLTKLFTALSDQPITPDGLASRAGVKPDDVERWLSKLWVAGGALLDNDGGVLRGDRAWAGRYETQRAHKVAQLDAVQRFVGSSTCRMLGLVGHFGDRSDSGRPCGLCDVCAPAQASLLELSAPTPEDLLGLVGLVDLLIEWNGQATGRLHRELSDRLAQPALARPDVERLLDGLARAGWLRFEDDSFEKDGDVIRFRRAHLIHTGEETPRDADLSESVRLLPLRKAASSAPSGPRGVRSSRKRTGARASKAKKASTATHDGAPAGRSSRKGARATRTSVLAQIDAPADVVSALRAWRLGVSKQQRVPAYRVLTDRQLGEVAVASPTSRADLSAVPGVGDKKLERYADGILRVLKQVTGR